MHGYKLHYPVDAECLCCHVVMRFTFKSNSDQVICTSCQRHQGSTVPKLAQRDKDHVNLWRSELALAAEAHAERMAGLIAKLRTRDEEIGTIQTQLLDARHAIETELLEGPIASLQGWWDSIQIEEAHTARDQAYRSRDHALRTMWRLDKLHHDGSQPNHCSCGKTTGKCQEWQALTDNREFLYRWESKQIERLKLDQEHGLPDDHPEVLRTGRRSYRHAG